MSNKKILIIGAGVMQVPVILRAKERGLHTIVADYDPKAPGFAFADQCHLISTMDKEELLKLAIKENIDGCLTTSDAPVRSVSYIGEKLNLKTMPSRVAEICTNKYLQREIFHHNNINTPIYRLCDGVENLNDYSEFPYIIKPVDSSASRGVKKVHNYKDLLNAAHEALSYSPSGKFIIESYIEGREFSVETLSFQGKTHIIAITEKLTRGEDKGYFVEDTHIEPARITPEEKSVIEGEVLKALEIIGFDNCPSHTEIKLNNNGAYIIESACRLGGDYITSDLVPLSTGIDMLGGVIDIALGKTPDITPQYNKYSCVQFLNESNYFSGVELINKSDPNIIKSEVLEYSNNPIRNSLDRLGYIIIQSDSLFNIEETLNKINK